MYVNQDGHPKEKFCGNRGKERGSIGCPSDSTGSAVQIRHETFD
jgi:hypothetical protein